MRTQTTVEGIVQDGRVGYRRSGVSATEADVADAIAPAPSLAASDVVVEPVRWSVVLAGVVIALATFAALVVLAAALGVDGLGILQPVGLDVALGGRIIVAIIIGLIAFGLGGWVASRLAVYRSSRTGLLAGALLWAVTVPIMVFALASTYQRERMTMYRAPATTHVATTPGRSDANLPGRGNTYAPMGDDTADAQRFAGATVILLASGLLASLLFGYLGSRSIDRRIDRPRRHEPMPAPLR